MTHIIQDRDQLLCDLIALDMDLIPRPRGVSLNHDATQVIVCTRTGGNNRDHDDGYGEENDALAAHPNYVRDHDDDFDSTYAYWYFDIPADRREEAEALVLSVPTNMTELAVAMSADVPSRGPIYRGLGA